MKKIIRNNRGITLVALVITIIILLILAGITISSLTNTGLFENTNKAKLETKRSQIEEWLKLKLIETQSNNYNKTEEEIIELTRQNVEKDKKQLEKIGKNVYVDSKISTEENGTKVKPYFNVIVDKDKYIVSIEKQKFIGEAEKEQAYIDFEYTTTSTSITVKVTTDQNQVKKFEYYVKGENDNNYGEAFTTTDKEYTFKNLEQNKKYTIKVVAIFENDQKAEKEKENIKTKEQLITAGIYDASGNLLANWNTLINTYGLDLEKTYDANNYSTSSTSAKYIISTYFPSATKLVIDDSVEKIGEYALNKCENLKEIIIGYGVKKIENWAFANCKALKEIIIPDNVISIDEYVFSYCNGLEKVAIGNGVKTIGTYDFYQCDKLKDVIIGNSVTTINYRAFMGCSSLNGVVIPDTVNNIDIQAFQDVKMIYYNGNANGNPWGALGINDRISFEITADNYTQTGLTSLSGDVVIPDKFTYNGVDYITTKIGAYFLKDNKNVTSLTIPNTVYSLEYQIMNGATGITEINIPANISMLNGENFVLASNLKNINVDDNNSYYCSIDGILFTKDKTTIFKYPEGKEGTSYNIPNSVTTVGYASFYYCNNLNTVSIPNTVIEIGARAFEYSKISSINIPNSVKTIQYQAFAATKITSMDIPDSVTSLGNMMFWGCTSLNNVNIGKGITNLETNTFNNCSSLTTINIPNTITQISDYCFASCNNLSKVYFNQTTAPKFGKQSFYKTTGSNTTYYFKNSTVRNAFSTGNGNYYNSSYSTLSSNYYW